MKKVIITFALFGLVGSAIAQTPQKKSVALVTKQTGTWCVNCGQWGWGLGHDLYESVTASGKGIYMAVYGNLTGGPYGSPDLVNAADGIFDENYYTSGVPNFYVNGSGDAGNTGTPGWTSYTNTQLPLAAVNAFAATTPLVSSAANYSITGNVINSTAKSQFWATANGTYFMASYVVEDSVMAPQYPIATGATAVHVGVLRAQMTASNFWGEQIATGSVAENATATKTYKATLDPSWNKNHLRVFTVIWKQNGSKYEFVNAANSAKGSVTGIAELVNVESINLFPNPAKSNVTISLTTRSNMKLNLNITDALGRVVYNSNNMELTQGNNQFNVSTAGFANGNYEVTLSSGDGKVTKQLSVIN